MNSPDYKILFVDDDVQFAENLANLLTDEKFQVKYLTSGAEAVSIATEWKPHVILLDYKIPDLNGLQILEKLKMSKDTNPIPVVMITGTVSEHSLAALEAGAEDFIEKPFSPIVLIKKIRLILKKMFELGEIKLADKSTNNPADGKNILELGSIRMDLGQYRVFVANQEIQLTLTQFKLLQCILGKPSMVVSRDEIIAELEKGGFSITFGSVDVHIASLRRKISNSDVLIDTIRGVGYRMRTLSSL